MAGVTNQCCQNPPKLIPSVGSGHVELIGTVNTYVTGPTESNFAIVLVSDVFGYEAPKLRKLADKIAAAGFFVLVPDFLNGEPLVPNNPDRPFQAWFADHSPEKGFEDAKQVIEALKSRGVTKIGAAGFCWGAKVVVELAKHACIDAAVLLHPSFVTLNDIQEVKVPISILGAEIDQMSPPELVKQFDEALQSKHEVDRFVKIFPGVQHGWSVRYNDEDEATVRSAEEAHKDSIDWFTKYVKWL